MSEQPRLEFRNYEEDRPEATVTQLAGTVQGRLGLKLRLDNGQEVAVFLDRESADILVRDIPVILAEMDKMNASRN